MSVIEQALAICKATEENPDGLKSIMTRLHNELGFQVTWGHPAGSENLWTHPAVREHNDGQGTGVGILNTYFCDLRHSGDALWFTKGRIGNTHGMKLELQPEERKTCPQCGGHVMFGFKRYETTLVLKPGNKRRTRQKYEVQGWTCIGHPTDIDIRGCGWEDNK